jgi:predicted phosphodiesterase
MKLGVISDIHEDRDRLAEALYLLDQLGCHEVACLGDIVGFNFPSFGHFESRDASECLRLVRNNCKYIVAGNHDLFPAKKIPEHKAGFDYPENWYTLNYQKRKKLAGNLVWLNEENEFDTLLSAEEKEFLKSLPEYLVIETKGVPVFLSHYLYPDLSGSSRKHYDNFGPVINHLDFIEKNGCRLGFSGHRHVEGFYRVRRNDMKHNNFGEYQLEEELQWLVGPCIANGKKENGCMVFNTETLTLNVIPLHTPPLLMQVVHYNKMKDAD